MKKRIIIPLTIILITIMIIIYSLYNLNIIPHKKYTNKDFNIDTYISEIDQDNDGIDDQTDILNNVRTYIATTPKYKSKYYATGYPDDNFGVCTDVVAMSLKTAGYDLMELVNNHIKENKELYDIETIDKKIDFRRVRNLDIYFKHNIISFKNLRPCDVMTNTGKNINPNTLRLFFTISLFIKLMIKNNNPKT